MGQHSHFLQSYKPSSKVSQSIELMGQKLKITEQVLIQDYGFNYCMETLKTHNFAKCIEREGNILTERFLAIDMSVTRIFRSCACGRSNRFMEITFSTTLCQFIHLGDKPVCAVFQGWMKSFSVAKHLDTEYLMHFSVLWSKSPIFFYLTFAGSVNVLSGKTLTSASWAGWIMTGSVFYCLPPSPL